MTEKECHKIEKLTALEINQKNVMKELHEIKETLNEFIKSADNKYSAKWVEKFVISGFLALMGIILALIIKS